jgi:hypothetical protein
MESEHAFCFEYWDDSLESAKAENLEE